MLLTFILIVISILSPSTLSFQAQNLGMLNPRKSHSRAESRNSWVSIETLDFARVRTFYRHDGSWIAGGVQKGGGITHVSFWLHVKIASRIVSYSSSVCLQCLSEQDFTVNTSNVLKERLVISGVVYATWINCTFFVLIFRKQWGTLCKELGCSVHEAWIQVPVIFVLLM